MSNLGDELSELVLLKRITNGDLGAEPPAAGGYGSLGVKPQFLYLFFVTFWRKTVLLPLDHISHVFKAI